METSNPTPERPTPGEFILGEPDEVVSSRRSYAEEDDDGPGLFNWGRTVWSIVAVVVVIVSGVVAVQWATRSTDTPGQELTLSGVEINVPTVVPSASAPAVSATAEPTATPTRSATATPTATNTRPNVPVAPQQTTTKADPPKTQDPEGPAQPTRTTEDPDPAPPAPDPEPEDEDDAPADQVADPWVNLAASVSAEASSANLGLSPGNITDGSQDSYWEAFPGFSQTVTVDLGRVTTVGRVVLSLPAQGWHRRTQTVTVLGSADGGSFSTLKGSAAYQFRGGRSDNQASASFKQTPVRYVQLRFTGANGWHAAQLSGLAVHSS